MGPYKMTKDYPHHSCYQSIWSFQDFPHQRCHVEVGFLVSKSTAEIVFDGHGHCRNWCFLNGWWIPQEAFQHDWCFFDRCHIHGFTELNPSICGMFFDPSSTRHCPLRVQTHSCKWRCHICAVECQHHSSWGRSHFHQNKPIKINVLNISAWSIPMVCLKMFKALGTMTVYMNNKNHQKPSNTHILGPAQKS